MIMMSVMKIPGMISRVENLLLLGRRLKNKKKTKKILAVTCT